MSNEKPGGWTAGVEAIVYQACTSCGSIQYFQRSFCCGCGEADPVLKRAGGNGTVYATSLVTRAATPCGSPVSLSSPEGRSMASTAGADPGASRLARSLMSPIAAASQ